MSRIAVDVDGVLAAFVPAYAQMFINMTGVDKFQRPLDVPDLATCWDYPREQYGYNLDDERRVWRAIKQDPQFWLGLPPLPGADEALAKLDRLTLDGHEVYFVTARPGHLAKWQTEAWLQARGMTLPTVVMQGDKTLAWRCLQLDAYIDDKLDTCNDLMRTVIEERALTRVYMTDRPYNNRPVCEPELPIWDPFRMRHPGVKVVADVWEMLEAEGLV